MKSFHFFLIIIFFEACLPSSQQQRSYSIIPKPNKLIKEQGVFELNRDIEVCINDERLEGVLETLKNELSEFCKVSATNSCDIVMRLDSSWSNKEQYSLRISTDKIAIIGGSPKGVFYGIQTLKQLILSNSIASLPCLYIEDAPRFSYRGMHLDVARHFFSVDFIKRYIDLMAFHKYNTFHWHLTEDQGWRIEIKQYPKLQSIAAYREETMIGHFTDKPRIFDGQKYGGYYTQEQIREIVSYAADRFVEVIPEIEMPGHSLAALAAYPELACDEGPFKTATTWGVFEDVYCPTEATFTFLENVLSEVIDLFPSKYVHIGGDECPKTKWKESPFCQELIKKENLGDEHGLQSYFIQRIERYLNSKGKQIIGWDEILEGGLAPNATVMSWRGTKGGIEAAKSGHDVIMCPTTHCYFDYYQSKSADEPLAIGGYLPLQKVYTFEPTPSELTKEEAKFIRGTQCNLWTEYVRTSEHAEYMVYPRACALAEVNWSRKEDRNYDDFLKRMRDHLKRLERMGVNFAKHYYDASIEAMYHNSGSYTLSVLTNIPDQKVYYTTDGSAPSQNAKEYTEPIVTSTAIKFRTASYSDELQGLGRTQSFDFDPHLGTGAKLTLVESPSEQYKGINNENTLIDGVRGGNSFNGDSWLGFSGKDLIANMSFPESKTVSRITIGSLEAKDAWIYLPSKIVVNDLSKGKDHVIAELTEPDIMGQDPRNITLTFQPTSIVDIRIEVFNHGIIESGSPGAGQASWLFIDEIIIE